MWSELTAAALLCALVLATTPACSATSPKMEPTSLPAQTRGEEIAALEASIAQDRHTLEDLVADTAVARAVALGLYPIVTP